MATERMYELAFQYKGTKLWQQLYDDELFAVRLSDGAIGYCCVMGMIGEHNALALYVGVEGYQSYCAIRNAAAPKRSAGGRACGRGSLLSAGTALYRAWQ